MLRRKRVVSILLALALMVSGLGSTEILSGEVLAQEPAQEEETAEPQEPAQEEETAEPEKPADIKVSAISISGISKKVAAGKKIQLTAKVSPDNASSKAIVWSSGNKKVAKVSKNGLVTMKKKSGGRSVVITAAAADGSGVKQTYKIKSMKGVVKKITISGKKTVKAGKTISLKAKVSASSKANRKLKWTSSNPAYATVNSSGKVKALEAGKGKTVKITAKARDGSGKKKTVKIKISKGDKLSVSSDCAILINADTGEVLFKKKAGTRHANASTTKIMTAILALENTSLSDTVTASAYAASQEPTKLYLHAGESFLMKDMLHSLLIPSHNDTAVAIAEHISGSTEKFAELMNQKAKEIGCTNTHFVTPNGLDRDVDGKLDYDHYTTASDLAKIMRYALQYQEFRDIIGKKTYKFTSLSGYSYKFSTTDRLLGNLSGLIGGKTGMTKKAGHCFVGVLKSKSGATYISVTLGGATSEKRWTDSKKLLKYAYER